MNNRRASLLPTYLQACEVHSTPSKCQTFYSHACKDPVLLLITVAIIIGSFCLISGFVLLCIVSKSLEDQTSEAILLMGIGFFISSLSCFTWKLTSGQRLTQILDAIKEEAV